MRVTIEETSEQNENKRRTVVECQFDDVGLEETLDMILRGLLSYGYAPKDIRNTINKFASAPTPPEENK